MPPPLGVNDKDRQSRGKAAVLNDETAVDGAIYIGKRVAEMTRIVKAGLKVIEKELAVHKGTAMINSISLEKKRYEAMVSFLSGTDLKVIALCMSDEGMPKTADQRINIADKLINGLVQGGIELDNIYVDPLVQPLATNSAFGVEFLDAAEQIMTAWSGVHTMCGLSNISYGLPERKFLNQTFMTMATARGLDGAIVNPLDRGMMANIIAAETLAGRDDFCANYLQAYRVKKLNS